nr:MAG TPA: hypothetical protein [Caudoviricetes sp.]
MRVPTEPLRRFVPAPPVGEPLTNRASPAG